MLSGGLGVLKSPYQKDGLSQRGGLSVPVDILNIENGTHIPHHMFWLRNKKNNFLVRNYSAVPS